MHGHTNKLRCRKKQTKQIYKSRGNVVEATFQYRPGMSETMVECPPGCISSCGFFIPSVYPVEIRTYRTGRRLFDPDTISRHIISR